MDNTINELKQKIISNENKIENLLKEKEKALSSIENKISKDYELKKVATIGLATAMGCALIALVSAVASFAAPGVVVSALLGVSSFGMIAGSVTSFVCDTKINNKKDVAYKISNEIRVSDIDVEIDNLREENNTLQEKVNSLVHAKKNKQTYTPVTVNVTSELKEIQEEYCFLL